MNKLNRAVFLDRDGVLNKALLINDIPSPPSSIKDIIIPEDVPEGLKQLKAAGLYLLVCTNQPDVGRGTQTKGEVEAINNYLKTRLCIDEIYVCFDAVDGSIRRKPNPGMLFEGARDFSIDLSSSFMIGDRWRDIEAGRRASCKCVFIDQGYTEKWPVEPAEICVNNFAEATKIILNILEHENLFTHNSHINNVKGA